VGDDLYEKWLLILCALISWRCSVVYSRVGNALFYGLILACPLSHIFLMKHGDKKSIIMIVIRGLIALNYEFAY
jgi:hypothetical protein